MSDKKLTPRVGDRVIVYKSENPNLHTSKTGTVTGGAGRTKRVDYDTGHHQWLDDSLIHVLDREPVEWPEKWKAPDEDGEMWIEGKTRGCYVAREVFDRVRGPEGDYVARNWDELTGDGS